MPLIKSTAPFESTQPDILNAQAGQNIIYNYPNPFSTSTTINFRSEGGHVLIQLFNNQGRLLNTLINKDYDQGSFEVILEGGNYMPGTYLLHMQNGSAKQTRNILLIK